MVRKERCKYINDERKRGETTKKMMEKNDRDDG